MSHGSGITSGFLKERLVTMERSSLKCLLFSCFFVAFLYSVGKGFSQSNLVPTIIVGKGVSKFFKDADSNQLSRAILLNQFLAQTSRPSPYPYATFIVTPQEPMPYAGATPYRHYLQAPSQYSYARPQEQTRYPLSVPKLQMRVKIESTDPAWTLALEVNNPNPFAVALNFLTEQQFDFILEGEGTGERIWQWSAGRSGGAEKETVWLDKGETKKFTAVFDPNSVRLPDRLPLLLKGILYSYPTSLSVEAFVVYQEKDK